MSAKDHVTSRDGVAAGLETEVTSAKKPCSDCGAETKEHKVDPVTKCVESRICSKCRKVDSV